MASIAFPAWCLGHDPSAPILCVSYAQDRENVIAGTDCGLGGRVHADLAWAKLRTLVEGARLASKSLWS